MNSKFNKACWLLGLTITLASCGQSTLTTQLSGDTEYSILDNARPVPLLVGQAIAFDRHLGSAESAATVNQQAITTQTLNSADKLHMTTVEVNDLLGKPFNHLTFVTTFAIDDPLTYGLRLSNTQAAAETTNAQSMMIGASTARVPMSSVTDNQTALRAIALTVQAIGGKNKLREWVSFSGNDLYARDISGQLWDTGNQQPLNAEVTADLNKKYRMVAARNSKDADLARTLNAAWDEYLSAMKHSGQVVDTQSLEAPSLSSYANADGTLNAQAAGRDFQKRIQSKEISSQGLTQYNNCWWAYFYTKCAMRDTGTFDTLIAGGGIQNAYALGAGSTVFKSPAFTTGSWVAFDAIGCGPATAENVLFWYWKRNNAFLKNQKYDGVNNYNSALNTQQPIYNSSFIDNAGIITNTSYNIPDNTNIIKYMNTIDASGYPYMTSLMKGQYLNGGVVVDPYGFRTGLQNFLNSQSSVGNTNSATVRSGYVTPTDSLYENNNYSDTIRSILHAKFLTNEPVVAVYTIPSGQYNVTAGSAHFSPITSFTIHEGTSWVDTFVRTVDHHGIDINLNTPWDYVHGVFAINGLNK